MSYGPNPWQQQSWDARAAGNFIGGGSGCGLLMFAALAAAQGALKQTLIVLALLLVSGGLLCVWAEIGRPWRALNVLFNPRSSWMSREAALAPLLLGSALAALLWPWLLPLAALAAAAFLYCQARILQAAKGIPAWREPLTVPLLVATGAVEGAGLYWLVAPWFGQGGAGTGLAFGLLLAARWVIAASWHRRLSAALGPAALRAVDRAHRGGQRNALLALALVLIAVAAPLPSTMVLLLLATAGALASVGGARFKFDLVTRAGFNQGFSLPHLPVRGVRH